jgi:potassium-dependent mechanosensitive channel
MNRACFRNATELASSTQLNLHEQKIYASCIRPIKNNFVRMKRFVIFYSFLFICLGTFAQSKHKRTSNLEKIQPADSVITDSMRSRTDTIQSKNEKLMMATDTLTSSDYMMSIERVNDNLNTIADSAVLRHIVVMTGQKINDMTTDIRLIRQNLRDKHSALNIKNLYLYQSFISDLDSENKRIQTHLNMMYHRVYYAKLHLRTVLSDSIFRLLYADSSLRKTFNRKLVRLGRKWNRADSTTKANIDTLNALKVKVADNSMSLSNMLNVMDNRLDKASKQLFGPEVNCLWKKPQKDTLENDTSKKVISLLDSEQKAISYYFSQTSGKRTIVFIFGFILFIWLFVKRKLLKTIREQKDSFSFLNLQYLNSRPVLSLIVLILCLMPFFDAYAPSSYIAIEYFLLLLTSTVIFFKKENRSFLFCWLALVVLFIADSLTYLLTEPTLVVRLWLLIIHTGIIGFSLLFYRKLNKQKPYYNGIKWAAITGIVLSVLAILFNLFGRISLSGIFGLAGIFAVTQAAILPVFIETIIEFILLQLQNSRMKKGINKPFDSSILMKKIKMPLIIIAIILWFIMLTSNLNIYHFFSNSVAELLTSPRSIGSISFKLISVLMFFVIIWFAHILQRLISFLFGETGVESEDITSNSKGQHSRLLITRLLVLIGGYLLAIAASGLPIDKLTFLLGALGVGIGMGLQNVVNNFVSGIILIFDGSLQIGDEIEVNGQSGKVKEIGLRASRLSTADGAEVIIPNGHILSENIVNWTLSNDQKRVVLGFSLSGNEMDANVVNEIINGTIKKIPNVISQRNPVILYTKVTQGNYSITVRFWSTINNADQVKSEAKLQLSDAFAAKNIAFK